MDGDKTELRLWLTLLSTSNLIARELRNRLRLAFNITLPQFDLMAQLHRQPDGLRLGEISKRMMVSNGNITGLIARMEADGLVRRETADQDRRVAVARLTEQGAARFAEMAEQHEQWLIEMLADLDHDHLPALMKQLSAVKASVAGQARSSKRLMP